MNPFISLHAVVPRIPDVTFAVPFSFSMNKGEVWTFYGRNGSGKTLLSEVISGRYGLASGCIEYPFMDEERAKTTQFIYPRQFIKTIHFQSTYSFSDFRDAYYQQRFNVYEVDWYPTVEEVLRQDAVEEAWWLQVVSVFRLHNLLSHRLITLSSGQLRRLLMAKALLEKPRMMIFDNPFIGLDEATRNMMEEVFAAMMQQGIQLLFLVADARDIPSCTTHLLHLDACAPAYVGPVQDFQAPSCSVTAEKPYHFASMHQGADDYAAVVDMRGVCIQYDGLVFQPNVTWRINKGEKWALLGPNGSGKSTLLSYIFADNPQAYSLPIWLFDRKRGSGESIWDIKKRIGYTSSEMHLYYRENVPCQKVVQSGFFDSVGLYQKCSEAQLQQADELMRAMGLLHLKDRPFLRTSAGEQRMLLFARALIKNPALLILDEPFHGMDSINKQKCLNLIDKYARQPDKSLIFVTHYQKEIPACVQQVYQLKEPAILKQRNDNDR